VLRFTPPEGPRAQRGPLPQDRAPTPFSPAPALKPLTVVVGSEWIDGLDGNDLCSPDVILGGLLTHDAVRLLRDTPTTARRPTFRAAATTQTTPCVDGSSSEDMRPTFTCGA